MCVAHSCRGSGEHGRVYRRRLCGRRLCGLRLVDSGCVVSGATYLLGASVFPSVTVTVQFCEISAKAESCYLHLLSGLPKDEGFGPLQHAPRPPWMPVD